MNIIITENEDIDVVDMMEWNVRRGGGELCNQVLMCKSFLMMG